MDFISMAAAAGVIYLVIFANNIDQDLETDYCVDCGFPSQPKTNRCYECITQENSW